MGRRGWGGFFHGLAAGFIEPDAEQPCILHGYQLVADAAMIIGLLGKEGCHRWFRRCLHPRPDGGYAALGGIVYPRDFRAPKIICANVFS